MTYKVRMAAGLIALAMVGAACSSSSDSGTGAGTSSPGSFSGTSITFSVSLAQSETAAVREVLSKFEAATGAKVALTQVTAQDLPSKLQVEVNSGNHTIHLFAQDNLSLAILVDKGLVEDLSDVQVPSGVTQALIPEKFDGKQYFLPFRPNVRVTYVNKDRFSKAKAEAPKTIDEYKDVAQKLKAEGGSGKVTISLANQPDSGPLGVTISEWIVAYGGNPLIINDDGSVKAFSALQQMWKAGVFAQESKLAKYDTEVDYLKGETSWFATNWPFTTSELAKAGVLSKFEVYEGWSGPSRAAHVVGGDVLGIPKGVSAKERAAAVALAQYLESKEAQTILVAKNSWPSVRSDALADVPADQKATFEAISKALENGWYRPNVIYWSDVQSAMDSAVTKIIYGGQDPATVLKAEHDKISAAAKAKGATYPPAG